MKNFIIIRHGPISEEYRKVFYGQMDIPLSSEGERLSLEVVKELKEIPLKRLFSSPLKRALYPAYILSKEEGIPLEIREELKEINYGEWAGRPREEVYKEPLYWERLKKDYLSPPGGESLRDLRRRARNFWELVKPLEEGNYAIFTHGGFIRAFLCELLGLESSLFFSFEVYHLKAVLITLFEDGLFVIKGLNLKPGEIKELLAASYW
ncbi:MAG: histidine phosphatase family protein [Caldimicrobium sp.]